jgi:hypothetical protein
MSTAKGKKQTPDGVRLFKTPPAGFDLRKASDRELAIHGLPRRPDPRTHPRLAARWESIAARPLQFVSPEFRIDPPFVRTAPALRASTMRGGLVYGISSQAWSGAFVNRQNSDPLDAVTATWTVPAVSPPLSAWNGHAWPDAQYTCATWVGLDGYHVNELLQAGIASTVLVSDGKLYPEYFAWSQWFDVPAKSVSGFLVSAGDQVSCGVCAPFEDTHGVVSFVNHTTGVATTFGVEPPSGRTLLGKTAEWIVEDPTNYTQTGGMALASFPYYGFDFFTDCVAGSRDYELNLSSATTINLINSDNELLSWAAIISPTTLLCESAP